MVNSSKNPQSDTGGVMPIQVEGRLGNERERLRGMTDAERQWRSQWLKDQELAPDEPRYVPELERELTNPIRRFYQKPWNVVFTQLQPYLGKHTANMRWLIPKVLMSIGVFYATYYMFKYNANDWTRAGGWRIHVNKTRSVPGEPDFPRLSDRHEPEDYAERGFKSRKVFQD